MNPSLKQALINSLEQLSDQSSVSHRRQLKSVVSDLKREDVIIPENDYGTLMDFIEILIAAIPTIKTHPKNIDLEYLYNHCYTQINRLTSKRGH